MGGAPRRAAATGHGGDGARVVRDRGGGAITAQEEHKAALANILLVAQLCETSPQWPTFLRPTHKSPHNSELRSGSSHHISFAHISGQQKTRAIKTLMAPQLTMKEQGIIRLPTEGELSRAFSTEGPRFVVLIGPPEAARGSPQKLDSRALRRLCRYSWRSASVRPLTSGLTGLQMVII